MTGEHGPAGKIKVLVELAIRQVITRRDREKDNVMIRQKISMGLAVSVSSMKNQISRSLSAISVD